MRDINKFTLTCNVTHYDHGIPTGPCNKMAVKWFLWATATKLSVCEFHAHHYNFKKFFDEVSREEVLMEIALE
jgi:hypothetical protein